MRILPKPNDHFDAVIIGSGFGGSVMAYRLATAGYTVCVLERGKAYPPGSFARTPFELRNNFWQPDARRYGLFDVWSFAHIDACVSAGVGGGSLIYANVLIRKDENWFDPAEHWPVTRKTLDPHYDAVEKMLAPQVYPQAYGHNNKTAAMQRVAGQLGIAQTTYDNVDPTVPQWYLPQLAVMFSIDDHTPPQIGEVIPGSANNIHRALRETCRLCGECDVGCNYGAKSTLDYNYLSHAENEGALICQLCEARDIVPTSGGPGRYETTFIVHDPDNPFPPPAPERRTISSDILVVACGTLGTNHLLLRNRKQHLPNLSPKLGFGFSSNGDYLAFARNCTVNDETPLPLNASRAPVVTSTFRFPDRLDGNCADGRGFYVQDAGYPLAGDYIWEGLQPLPLLGRIIKYAWKRLTALVWRSQTEIGSQLGALVGDGAPSLSTMPLLGVGRDIPDGELTLEKSDRLELSWRTTRSKAYLDRIDPACRDISDALGGSYDADPITKVFNRLVTVHPLGGCRMGLRWEDAVVDESGEVFNYPGLYVADGSVMPGPVGPNPSFTIAAVADLFATRLIAKRPRSGGSGPATVGTTPGFPPP